MSIAIWHSKINFPWLSILQSCFYDSNLTPGIRMVISFSHRSSPTPITRPQILTHNPLISNTLQIWRVTRIYVSCPLQLSAVSGVPQKTVQEAFESGWQNFSKLYPLFDNVTIQDSDGTKITISMTSETSSGGQMNSTIHDVNPNDDQHPIPSEVNLAYNLWNTESCATERHWKMLGVGWEHNYIVFRVHYTVILEQWYRLLI